MRLKLLALAAIGLPHVAAAAWVYDHEVTAEGAEFCIAQNSGVGFDLATPTRNAKIFVFSPRPADQDQPQILFNLESGYLEGDPSTSDRSALELECYALWGEQRDSCAYSDPPQDPERHIKTLDNPISVMANWSLRSRKTDLVSNGWVASRLREGYYSYGIYTSAGYVKCLECALMADIQYHEYQLKWRTDDGAWQQSWVPWRNDWSDRLGRSLDYIAQSDTNYADLFDSWDYWHMAGFLFDATNLDEPAATTTTAPSGFGMFSPLPAAGRPQNATLEFEYTGERQDGTAYTRRVSMNADGLKNAIAWVKECAGESP